MYPYELFFGIDLYTVMLGIAVFLAIIIFRIYADKFKMKASYQNFCLLTGGVSIAVGYFSAVLFQAFYNIEKYGKFQINSETGATFYGGLIGGALTFIVIYFGIGRIKFKDSDYVKSFFDVANIAAASISIAHAVGRVGCFWAGCCHGKETDAWYGVYMAAAGAKVVPVQLFEAIFLALLFAFFLFRLAGGKRYNLAIYMCTYGIWRFVMEYFRDDYRGSTVVDFLTPSQLVALLMALGAICVGLVEYAVLKKIKEKAENTNELE